MNLLPFDDSSDCIFIILIAQGLQSDILLKALVNEGQVLSAFYLEPLLCKK